MVYSNMKFLLAISSKEYSESTLIVGSLIAKTFNADLSLVYVGEKPKQIFEGRIKLARDSLAKWEIYHPGIEVLKWAFKYLQSSGYLETTDENGFNPENIVDEHNRYRLVLQGSFGRDVDLILREGKIIDELRKECFEQEYTLTIIGGSKKRRMAHDLVQYLPTSIFVVQNLDSSKQYKLLLCVDDSKATKSAVRFGATIAKNQGMFVNTLTVSKTTLFGKGYKGAAKAAGRYLKSQNIPFEQHFITGDPVNTFLDFAGDDHIIVMGDSKQSPLLKFFFGSKPIKTMKKASCPILVVR